MKIIELEIFEYLVVIFCLGYLVRFYYVFKKYFSNDGGDEGNFTSVFAAVIEMFLSAGICYWICNL